MTASQQMGSGGLRGAVATDRFECRADFGHAEAVLPAGVPVLRHVLGRHLSLFHESVQRRARDAQFLGDGLCGDQRFLLTHIPSLSQPTCPTILDSGTMRQLDSSTERKVVREIPLTQGKVALVDDEDYDWLSRHRWCARRDKRGAWYAMRGVRIGHRTITVLMHGVLLGGTRVGKTIDHKDRDGLNNQRSNLRWADKFEQQHNTGKRQANQSGFKGVYRHAKNLTWIAQIAHRHQQIYLGSFKDSESAARAYDQKATELHGEFAVLNFPSGI